MLIFLFTTILLAVVANDACDRDVCDLRWVYEILENK